METWQIIVATAAMLLAVVGGNWAITSHYFKLSDARNEKKFEEVDRRFELIDRRFELIDRKIDLIDRKFDQKFDIMNGRIFDLSVALRPHIREVQDRRVAA